ncbi:TIGR00180 family glycosyltransferase [Desulfovibrio caledoniensis]
MSNPYDKITIVIPTYRRHHLLGRLLPYIAEIGFQALVVDCSDTPYQDCQAHPTIEYIHTTEEDGVSRLKKYALDRIKTPYILLNADDMFPSRSFILNAVETLEAIPGSSAVIGDCLGYKDGRIRFQHCEGHHHYPTDCDRPSARLLQHFARHCPLTYSVMRTDCWIETLMRVPRTITNYNFQEFYVCMIILIYGKVTRIPGVAHIVDDIPSTNISSKKHRGSTKDMRSDPMYYPQLNALKETVQTFLSEREQLPPAIAMRYVEAALDMYFARILPSREYYWLRNKPPKTFRDRLQREWANLMGKLFPKERRESERISRMARVAREDAAAAQSIVGREDECSRISDILSGKASQPKT